MTKKILFSLVLVALLISFVSVSAMAQDTNTKPVASVRENVAVRGTQPILKHGWTGVKPGVPSYCNDGSGGHCLFYAGDFNANDSNANGLANETDEIITGSPYGSAVYAPFVIPSIDNAWTVTGMFGNVLASVGGVNPGTAYYEIRTGVSSGNAGTLVTSGTVADSYIATGRNGFGLNEYTVKVYIPIQSLSAGTYWMIVIPACTSGGSCSGARYFLSDVEDKPPLNALGQQPGQDSFWTSGFFGSSYEQTWGTSGACAGLGCNRFSIGVIGSK